MVSLSHRRSYVEHGKNINLFVCVILKFKLKKNTIYLIKIFYFLTAQKNVGFYFLLKTNKYIFTSRLINKTFRVIERQNQHNSR